MTKLLSPILAELSPGYVQWWCPGCEERHHVPVASQHNPGSNWGYNGNPDAPTFTPSVLIRGGHFAPGWQGPKCWCTPREDGEAWDFQCKQCHTFITDGKIVFLSDCSHHLAGQTVDMVPFPVESE